MTEWLSLRRSSNLALKVSPIITDFLDLVVTFLCVIGSLTEMIETAEEALSIIAEREHRSNSYHSNVP
jgi:hypothetical protein